MSFTEAHLGDLAAALVDDQLDQTTRNQVLLHLGRCPGCRGDVEEQRQLKARLHSLGVPGLPTGLVARLGALSHPQEQLDDPFVAAPELLAALPSATPLTPQPHTVRRSSMMGHPQRGRRMLVGAASLLLVGAGTAVASGGDAQAGPSSPSSSTFSTSFSTPLSGANSSSFGRPARSSVPLRDPAFGAMTASFNR